ncbi:MAG TPA: RES family NAD+ phosphorylase [Vicinamibacterales bacterium]|nr:RES family NAD+ phosphorylase [Vicinamibacterales bacterium]
MPTWTTAALSRESRRLAGRCWRVVESQHMVSTMKIVDTIAEQARLEELLEESKPAIPEECRGLHYLLFTPFRYGAPYPRGSRFRRAGITPGVFYACIQQATAVAEMAFWRLLFYAESPHTPWPSNAGEYTAFSVRFSTSKGLDLTQPPLDRDAEKWTHPTDYSECHALADAAREAGVTVLRYQSARAQGENVALLSCSAFASKQPIEQHRWRIHVGASGARAIGEDPAHRLAFDRAFFARDPRISHLSWQREE